MPYKNFCCVPGCLDRSSTRHRLPVNDVKRFDIWKRVINNPKFEGLSDESLRKNYMICNNHFGPECFSPGTKRLNANAIPALHVSGENTSSHDDFQKTTSLPCIDILPIISIPPSTLTTSDLSKQQTADEKCALTAECDNPNEISPNRVLKRSCLPEDGQWSTPKRRKLNVKSCCRPVLASVKMCKAAQLTPKARKLYAEARYYRTIAAYHKKARTSFKRRLECAKELSLKKCFNQVNVNPVAKRFILSQLETCKFKRKGRRFTFQDKVLALALFKQSRKGYSLLSRIFNLPSRTTLTNLLCKIPFGPGINNPVFEHLKKSVKKLKPRDRICVLMFDEMSLSPQIQWNEASDTVVGFEDYGHRRSVKFADHVLTFMVRGVSRKWKQPVCYVFSKETTSTPELVHLIKEVIRAVSSTGLQIVATVCDQGKTNVAAINSLVSATRAEHLRQNIEFRDFGFSVDGSSLIVPLYDCPHLIKGVRNNFLKYDIHFTENSIKKIARWQHVEDYFEIDQQRPSRLRSCPKWTKYHVDKKFIKKMKVSYAAQVFSHRAATAMRQVAERPCPGQPYLNIKATDTADFLLFIDELFDSMNGFEFVNKEGKPLRCAISRTSPHIAFWETAVQVLRSIKFIDSVTGKVGNVQSVKNWIHNIRGFQELWKKLNTTFKYLPTRSFNQDSIENFFGSIRSHGVRNINPSCSSFSASFKSLLVNNFISLHSVGYNCEDDCTSALDTLSEFLTATYVTPLAQEVHVSPPVNVSKEQQSSDKCVPAWVAGYIVRQLRKVFSCEVCFSLLTTTHLNPEHGLIFRREYIKDKRLLVYPTTNVTESLVLCCSVIYEMLPKICHLIGVGNCISTTLHDKITLTTCASHVNEVRALFIKIVCILIIHNWCKSVTGILCGKVKVLPTEDDPIKLQAHQRYIKYSKKK